MSINKFQLIVWILLLLMILSLPLCIYWLPDLCSTEREAKHAKHTLNALYITSTTIIRHNVVVHRHRKHEGILSWTHDLTTQRLVPICEKRNLYFFLYKCVRESWIEFNNFPTRCNLFSLLHFCRQLYMFLVLTPIIRSSYNCNYSFWYWLTAMSKIRWY